MKTKILDLLKGMSSDSKKESYKCEKELCKILNDICAKMETIENLTYPIRNYTEIVSIDNDMLPIDNLPKYIYCNEYSGYETFEFYTEWLDLNMENYFEVLKEKAINIKKATISNVEYSLIKHKKELESLQNLTFENLDIKN
jgi:hypothetical protein